MNFLICPNCGHDLGATVQGEFLTVTFLGPSRPESEYDDLSGNGPWSVYVTDAGSVMNGVLCDDKGKRVKFNTLAEAKKYANLNSSYNQRVLGTHSAIVTTYEKAMEMETVNSHRRKRGLPPC